MSTKAPPLTVSQLNRQIRTWLEQDVGDIHVLGELSNVSRPASGHLYFTLKDEGAQLRCAYFKSHHTALDKTYMDGQQVIAHGRLSLYEARGDYQLIVRALVPAGIGELYQQYERLKLKLEQQGLFAAEKKKPIPRFPTTIAIITSGSGAALRDILSTLARRYPIAAVHIYPCEVQGKNAAGQIVQAIKQANQDNKADVILLARGGGSIEDLWAFNDEKLANTIGQSVIPLISGVGHETDFTIADFVADWRAETPTAAATIATPDRFEIINFIGSLMKRMLVAITRIIQRQALIVSHLIHKISSLQPLISSHFQTIDYLERQLNLHWAAFISRQSHRLQIKVSELQSNHPKTRLMTDSSRMQHLQQRLLHSMEMRIKELKQPLHHLFTTLHAVSPLATLNRGYAIATTNIDKVILNSDQVQPHDNIKVTLAKGSLSCQVINKGE
jgi:exodeoxyribonuclease VII large subunit